MQLSICIATFNRAAFIGATLDSIVGQLSEGVEIVIVDGASPDNTAVVVAPYVAAHPAIRYIREAQNSGVDRDYDKAVGYAAGEHCWLMTDDDTLAPGAVARVLEALEGGAVDLLVVDSEVRDLSLTQRLKARRLGVIGEHLYGPADADAFLRDAGYSLSFIGGVVIRRRTWLERDRERFFGSLFIHVGVILQSPPIPRVKVVGEPLIRIRLGNAMWKARGFEIWAFKWPGLIWSFEGYGDAAKQAVTPREPWRSLQWLMGYRALGAYSLAELRAFFAGRRIGPWRLAMLAVALFPGPLANLVGVCALALMGKGAGDVSYDMVVSSRYSNPASRFLVGRWLNLSGTSVA